MPKQARAPRCSKSYIGLGEGIYWTNAVTQIAVAPNAVLRHYKLQAEGSSAFHVAATSVRLDHQAAYRMFAASLGSELGRNEVDVDLAATDAVARLAGTTLARGAQHLDTTIRIEHSKPRGTSSQEFKAVVDGRAHAVFQGRIRVAPDAQKTDAQQVSRSLLLSSTAAADTKPELEILADDVKCSHGATIGDLDEEALFYLRARGVGEAEARKMLIDAFIGELIEHITVDYGARLFSPRLRPLARGRPPAMTAIQPITCRSNARCCAYPAGLSDPFPAGSRQAARIPRQCRKRAKAALGDGCGTGHL